MKTNTLKICVTAAGIALFVVLSLCLQVPVFENYYLCLGYIIFAIYCYSFGTIMGTTVGVLGVVLYCIVTSGLRGMPGWALGNLVIGIMLGLTFRCTRRIEKPWVKALLHAAAILISVTAGILLGKSALESVLYAQLFLLRIGKNVYAWAADLFVLLFSLPICMTLDGTLRKMFPKLTAEESLHE